MTDSDREWARLGRVDPYLRTVRTLDPYKLDPSLAGDSNGYFASGEHYVADLFATIARHVGPGFKPRTAVDFGCSVGRVALPLAVRCESVIGLDVSRDALAEAERNAARLGVSNVRWLPSDDELSQVTGPVDLFHSYNVLQHLPVRRGLRIVRRALALLAPGGVIAVHVPYADRASPLRRAVNWAQAYVPGVHHLANIARGRPHDYPHMLMNAYDLNALLSILREHGGGDAYCKLVDQGRYPGTIVIASMPGGQAG
jgi:2-polyprenyl-3-methyl-5-hydroxy-6-metoxy-1,4-benzoquinol methylase